jgi:hypothetical protein
MCVVQHVHKLVLHPCGVARLPFVLVPLVSRNGVFKKPPHVAPERLFSNDLPQSQIIFLFKMEKGVSLNHLYNAWNTAALHSSLGLVPSLLDPEAPGKRCPLASTSILRFSPLEIDLPFGSPQKSLGPKSSNQQLLKNLQNKKTSPPVYNGLPTKNPAI